MDQALLPVIGSERFKLAVCALFRISGADQTFERVVHEESLLGALRDFHEIVQHVVESKWSGNSTRWDPHKLRSTGLGRQ